MRAMSRRSRVTDYAAGAVIVAIIGAGIWWRASGEPTLGGLVIVGTATPLVLGAVLMARRPWGR
jgi:hypothetical protein